MAVGRDAYYNPDQALQEVQMQETITNCAVDIQALLRVLVEKGTVTREEINASRQEVRNSPKYKATIESIEREKKGFAAAKNNPEEYLKSLLKAKMDGKIT